MDYGPLRALVLNINRDLYGVDVTVTVPGGVAVETRGIWATPEIEAFPSSADLRRRGAVLVMVLGRDHVPAAPRGTVVLAPPPQGGEPASWRVDGIEREAADHWRVYLVPGPAPEL
jgi:hypothetical protein